MPDAAYFRSQAETCRRLARSASDQSDRESLIRMAEEYERQAEALEDPAPPAAG